MTQIGKVVDIEGEYAIVEVKRASSCGENCAHCKGGCAPTNHRATVGNSMRAKKGDMVKIEMSNTSLIRSAFLVYIMPIVIMLFAYGIAFQLTQNTVIGVVSCILGLVIGFLLLKTFDQKIAPVPQIVRILTEKERTE